MTYTSKPTIRFLVELKFAMDGLIQLMDIGLILIFPIALPAQENFVGIYKSVVGYGSSIMLIFVVLSFIIQNMMIKIQYGRKNR